jgi:hypothetical protein
MPVRAQVRWEIDDDAAWVRVGPGCYSHYSGVHLIQKEKQWNATAHNGELTSGYKTAYAALMSLGGRGFWHLNEFLDRSREYGPVRRTVSPVPKDGPMYFTFWAAHGDEFPSFVKSTLARVCSSARRCVQAARSP